MPVSAGEAEAVDEAAEVVLPMAGIEPARQPHRAQAIGLELVRQPLEFVPDESVVEARIVGDEHARVQQCAHLLMDRAEGRRAGDIFVSDAGQLRDPRGNRPLGVDQR